MLNYKRPRYWVVLASAIVLIGTGIALLSNPADSEQDQVKIVSSDYSAMAAIAGSAYPHVQSIPFTEHENINDNLSVSLCVSIVVR